MATPVSQSLEKALGLFALILEDDGQSALSILAERQGIPSSTAHRLVRSLQRQGMILKDRPGRYVAGSAMLAAIRRLDEAQLIARLSRPALRRLSATLRQTVHLGVLEDGMVTYLVKETRGAAAGFTREGMQLEAYCSAIGKVLLAHLPAERLAQYLADGPFVALTGNTIIKPAVLLDHLNTVRAQGWALDDAEVFDDLKCVAVPLRRADGSVVAAISVSAPAALSSESYRTRCLRALKEAVERIEARMALPRASDEARHAG